MGGDDYDISNEKAFLGPDLSVIPGMLLIGIHRLTTSLLSHQLTSVRGLPQIPQAHRKLSVCQTLMNSGT